MITIGIDRFCFRVISCHKAAGKITGRIEGLCSIMIIVDDSTELVVVGEEDTRYTGEDLFDRLASYSVEHPIIIVRGAEKAIVDCPHNVNTLNVAGARLLLPHQEFFTV